MAAEKTIKHFSSLEEAKQFHHSDNILGIMITGILPSSEIKFEVARCSSLENTPEKIQELKQGNCVFVQTREDKIKYFFFCRVTNKMLSVSFGKPLFQDWKEFYLETLAQVFGPEQ